MNKIATESDVDISTAIADKTRKSVATRVSKEIIRYDENHHLRKNIPEGIVELYRTLKQRILDLGDSIEIRFGNITISFKQNKVFTDVIFYKKGIKVEINMRKGHLKDPLRMTEDLSDKRHWGNGDYRVWLKHEDDLEYTMSLIRQAYQHQL